MSERYMKIKSILKNEYIFAVITRVVYAILGLLATILIARYLGSEFKGQVAYIQSIVATTAIIFGLGIHHTYLFYRKNEGDDYKYRFMGPATQLILFYVLIAVIISVISNNDVVRYSALLTPLYIFTAIISCVLLVENPNKMNGSKAVFVFVQCLAVILCMVFITEGVFIGVVLVCLPECLNVLYSIYTVKWSFSIKRSDYQHLKILIKYGFLPMIALLLTTLNYRIDILMLKGFKDISYSQIGIYSIGISFAEKALLISDAVKEILLSKLSKGRGEEEVATVMRMCFPIAVFFAIVIGVLGKPMINIMFGNEYQGAYLVTAINLIGTIFMVFFKMITQYNIVNNKQKYNIIFLSVSVIINIICNLILIPQYSIYGAAFASTIGYWVSAIIYLSYFSKHSGISVHNLIILNSDDISQIKKMIRRGKESK